MVTSNFKATLISLQGGSFTPKNHKPHQPRFEVKNEFITSGSDSDLLVLSSLVQPTNPFLEFSTMLVDNGATKCCIDNSFESTHKLTMHR